ncbi:MAG TPA: HlyD family efflux transporter periplasmic adaptor subunit, partial [Granulicella sp.]|nr:HlyD family efflux transporter periplasmic adaptor subunit [Granulicella sp.]
INNYNGANIRSTIAGTVYSVPVSEYDYVNAGEELVDVADLNRVRVRAYFDEPEIGNLVDGQPVRIIWDAKPGKTWHGHIYRTPTTVITYGTRNVGECIITVDDAKGDLLPNTNVTVTVTTREDDNVLSVPREALHTDGLQSYVFRVVNKRLVRTPVQVGVVNLTRAEITSGLSVKDVVALNALNNTDLTNDLAIKPVE